MADDIIRIGFVGAGGNTELRHIPGLQAIEGVELVIELPTVYQANHFRQAYEGAGFVRRAIEKVAGRYMDCRAYALRLLCTSMRLCAQIPTPAIMQPLCS